MATALTGRRAEFSAEIDQRSVSDFSRLLDEMRRTTSYQIPQVLRYGAKLVGSGLLRYTPIAPKKVTRTHIYLDATQSPTGVPTTIPVKPWSFRPKGRGYARQGWREALRKVTLSAGGADYWRGGNVAQMAEGIDKSRANWGNGMAYVELANFVSYIEKLDRSSDIVNRAINRAAAGVERRLSKLAREYSAKWR